MYQQKNYRKYRRVKKSKKSIIRGSDYAYKKQKKLGAGTYGVVYKAKDLNTKQTVAMKSIETEEGVDCTTLREIALLKKLSGHPNIVSLERVIVHNESLMYLVLEFCDNDLKKYMLNHRDYGGLDLDTMKSISYQILNGIQYLHQSQIMHRDLKPENILINVETKQIKIADFGLARCYHFGGYRQWTHEVITLWYRSPEVLLGDDYYNPSVDIWSVGCILYELYHDTKILFRGASEIDQLHRIFKICGSPNHDRYPKAKKLRFFSKKFPKWKPKQMSKVLKGLDYYGQDLLSRMLTLDPTKRVTAKQTLRHPYFRGVQLNINNH